MTKKHIIVYVAILAAIVIGVAVTLTYKTRSQVCTSKYNLRKVDSRPLYRSLDIDVTTRRALEMRDAYIQSIVPPGTPFSNAVAALGSHYTVWRTPGKDLLVRFPVVVPGVSNQLHVNFEVTSNNCLVEHMGQMWIGCGPRQY